MTTLEKIAKLTTRELPHLVQNRENNGLYSTPYEAYLKKSKACFCQKGEKCDEIAKDYFFQRSQKLLTENLYERLHIQNIQ